MQSEIKVQTGTQTTEPAPPPPQQQPASLWLHNLYCKGRESNSCNSWKIGVSESSTSIASKHRRKS
ncbi:MAG TPA: hypothetical protein VKA87_11210 [Nitrososphaeraceae archaeon]|nr:hypothetical protein [Nitrososphaeraceae archaeon]